MTSCAGLPCQWSDSPMKMRSRQPSSGIFIACSPPSQIIPDDHERDADDVAEQHVGREQKVLAFAEELGRFPAERRERRVAAEESDEEHRAVLGANDHAFEEQAVEVANHETPEQVDGEGAERESRAIGCGDER